MQGLCFEETRLFCEQVGGGGRKEGFFKQLDAKENQKSVPRILMLSSSFKGSN